MQPLVQMREIWTPEDLRALELEDWRRYEIVDGSLVVSPSPGKEHELASEEVRAAIRAALPQGVKVVGPMGIDLPRSYRIPDLLVLPIAFFHAERRIAKADDVLLAIEIVSPGSVTTDRITKPAQYAAAGIPAYWRVETDPISLTVYTLPAGSDTYSEVGTWGRGETAVLTEPFPVTIEIDRLAG